MPNDTRLITKYFFTKDSLEEVSLDEIEAFIGDYPYASPARYLLAKKKYDADPVTDHEELITAGLYINNPLWMHRLLTGSSADVVARTDSRSEEHDLSESHHVPGVPADQQSEQMPADPEAEHEQSSSPASATEPIIFQSYHTIDYFASQGIRLQQSELARDKLGQQLKSFTEWLRSMKKLPLSESGIPNPEPGDDSRSELVIRSAAHSIEEKEVYTEAMAEVWAKQGNRDKALDIYTKLSLLDPSKSAYFAAKIDQLK